MSLQPVHRFNQVRRFFEACRTRRADIAIIGDSNTFAAGTSGTAVGFQAAWGRRFGQYATGVKPTNAQAGWVYDLAATFGSGEANDAVPASHQGYHWAEIYHPVYRAGTLGENYTPVAAAIQAGHPNGVAGPLRWHVRYGTFATGSGYFRPVVRDTSSLTYRGYAVFPTNTGSVGMASGYVDVPAGSGGAEKWCCLQAYQTSYNGPTVGPFYSNYQRVEWPNVLTGVSVSALLYQGGQPTRTAANALAAMTQVQFNEWAAMLTVAQGGRHVLMVNVLQGQNDTNDTAASVGPRPAASNTPAGAADNTAAVVNRLRVLWAGSGRDVDDLYVLLGPYHPQEYTRRAWGRDLDDAYAAYADAEANVAVASRSRTSTSALFTAKGWYAAAAPDDAHLSAAGYDGWAEVAVNAVCPRPAALVRHTSGAAIDLKLFDEAGQVWYAAYGGFGPWANGSLADYVIPGTELGTSGMYRFPLPANLPRATTLRGHVTARAGGSPALTDTHVATLDAGDFDGLRQATLSAAAADAAAADAALARLDVPVSRAGTGAGAIAVDHDTGGTDVLRYVDGGGAGVGGAAVRAYVKADYDAGRYVERGRTVTRADGRWSQPLYLDAGVTYAVTFAKPGVFQMGRRDVAL